MTCEVVRESLSPFLDDELDPMTSRAIEEHVGTCATCAAERAEMQALRDRLRDELESHRAPDLLRARVLREVRAAAPRRERRPAVLRGHWLATAAAVVVLAGGAWLVASRTGGDALTHEVVSSHIRSLMGNHLTDVTSTDQHTVKPWFNGRVDYAPPVADFAADGYPLLGGRLDYLENRPVTALVYQRRKHVINVFVWPIAGEREALSPARTDRGFHVIRGTHAGMAFWIVSDLNADELAGFARRLAAPAGSSQAPGR